MKKRKWIFLSIFSTLIPFFVLYSSYPKWIIINREKKISQMPSKWKDLPIGIKREKILQFLHGSSDESIQWWPDKQELWIKKDRHGWYRLNISYDSDTVNRYYSIEYYFGNHENYKLFRLKEVGSP